MRLFNFDKLIIYTNEDLIKFNLKSNQKKCDLKWLLKQILLKCLELNIQF